MIFKSAYEVLGKKYKSRYKCGLKIKDCKIVQATDEKQRAFCSQTEVRADKFM